MYVSNLFSVKLCTFSNKKEKYRKPYFRVRDQKHIHPTNKMLNVPLNFDAEFPSPQALYRRDRVSSAAHRNTNGAENESFIMSALNRPSATPHISSGGAAGVATTLNIHDWELVEDRVPTEAEIAVRETLFAVGNGYIGIRGYHEDYLDTSSSSGGGDDSIPPHTVSAANHARATATTAASTNATTTAHHAMNTSANLRHSVFESTLSQNPVAGPTTSHRGSYINGFYDEHSTSKASSAFSSGGCKRECFLVAVPDAADVSLFVDDELVSPFMNPSRVTHYRRTLDLKTGELRRKYTWRTRHNVELHIHESRIVCAKRKHVAAIQLSVTCPPQPRHSKRDGSEVPATVDVKIKSTTGLPVTESSSGSWVMESIPTSNARQEDVSSLFCARTSGSRKRLTIAVNDRCCVTSRSQSTGSIETHGDTPKLVLGGSAPVVLSASANALLQQGGGGALPGGALPLSAHLATTASAAISFLNSPPPSSTLDLLSGGGGGLMRSLGRSLGSNGGPGYFALNSATFLKPHCSTPMRPQRNPSLGNPLKDSPLPTSTQKSGGNSHHQHRIGTTVSYHDTDAAPHSSHYDEHNTSTNTNIGEEPSEIPTTSVMLFRASILCYDVSSTVMFTKTVAYTTTDDCDQEDMERHANEQVENAVDTGYDGLLAEQRDFMEDFWAKSDLNIECTKSHRIQGTLRFNLLQLFMSTGRWPGTGIGPRGLTGEVFNGLQTWDAEIFVLPFFIHTQPDIAKSILQFRVDTLREAQRRALDFEIPRGAIYPSRTINGSENAPSLPCVLHLHVNADIAFAMQQYYQATNDVDFMMKGGIEVVWSTAVIWLEWGAWEFGSFHIRSVTGPDEYNVLVHDNFFTNLMARHHMRFAIDMYEKLKRDAPRAVLAQLMSDTSVSDEDFTAMRRAADKMALPYDPHNRIHLQDAGFLRKRGWDKVPRKERQQSSPLRSHLSPATSESVLDLLAHSCGGGIDPNATGTADPSPRSPRLDWTTGQLDPIALGLQALGSAYRDPNSLSRTASTTAPAAPPPVSKPHINTTTDVVNNTNDGTTQQPYMPNSDEGAPLVMIQEYHPVVVFRHKICKNADVVLAAVLLRDKFTHDEKEANFRYYERLTAHDSSLTPPMFCIAAADLQLREEAMQYFKYSLYMDMYNVMKNTSGGLHMSCLGGSWWCIVSGFAGFHVLDGVAHFNPWLPDGWTEYHFRIRHSNVVVNVHVQRRSVSYSIVDGNSSKLLIVHAQTSRVHLVRGRTVTIKLVRDVRSLDYDAVVFDIDSIIESVEEDQFNAWRITLDPILQAKEGPDKVFKPFHNELYLAYLRHHPISQNKRHQGLQRFLLKRGIELPIGDPNDPPSDQTLYGLIARKLLNFRQIVKARGVRPRDGVVQLMTDLKSNGVLIGVVSASKNGLWMMQQAPQVLDLLDCFLDARQGEQEKLRWRPELDFFDMCAKRMDVHLSRTIAVIDGIDGFSKKSLKQYWLVVNTSAEEASGYDGLESNGPLSSGGGGGSFHTPPYLLENSDEVQQVLVRDLTLLSTDVLQERGMFIPIRRHDSSGGTGPTNGAAAGTGGTATATGNQSSVLSPALRNTSFSMMPNQSICV